MSGTISKYYKLQADFEDRYNTLNKLTPEDIQERNVFNDLKNTNYFNPIEHEYAIGYYLFSDEKARQLDKNKYTNLFLSVLNINPTVIFTNLRIPNISNHILYVNKLNSHHKQILLDLIKYYKTFKIDTKTSYNELVSRFISFFNSKSNILDILIGQYQPEDEVASGIYTIRNWFIFFISFQRDFFKRNFQHRLMCLLDINLYKRFGTDLDLLFNHKVLKSVKTYFDTFPGTSDTTYQFFNLTYYDALKSEYNIDLYEIDKISTSDEFYEFISKVRGKTVTERDRLNEQKYLFLNNLTIKEYADQKRNTGIQNNSTEVQINKTDNEIITQLQIEKSELETKVIQLQTEINELQNKSKESAKIYFDLKDIVSQDKLNNFSDFIYNSLPIAEKNQNINDKKYSRLIQKYIKLLKKYRTVTQNLQANIQELQAKVFQYESSNLKINDEYLTIKNELTKLKTDHAKTEELVISLQTDNIDLNNERCKLYNEIGDLNTMLTISINTLQTTMNSLNDSIKPNVDLILKDFDKLKLKDQ